jgi:hypothetical protein
MVAPLLHEATTKLENSQTEEVKHEQEDSSSSTNLKEAQFEGKDEDERILKLQLQFLRCSLLLGCVEQAIAKVREHRIAEQLKEAEKAEVARVKQAKEEKAAVAGVA